MKKHRLNAKGFAHHLLLALIVVGVAIGGTYYVVFSKASSNYSSYNFGTLGMCRTSDSVVVRVKKETQNNYDSGQPESVFVIRDGSNYGVTNPNWKLFTSFDQKSETTFESPFNYETDDPQYFSIPVRGTNLQVTVGTGSLGGIEYEGNVNDLMSCTTTSAPPTIVASCVIDELPATLKPGQEFTPTITISNTGSTAIQNISKIFYSGSYTSSYDPSLNNYVSGNSVTDVASIEAGKSVTYPLSSIRASDNKTDWTMAFKAEASIGTNNDYKSFSCSNEPIIKVEGVKNGFAITVSGVPASITSNQSFTPTISITNTGNTTKSNEKLFYKFGVADVYGDHSVSIYKKDFVIDSIKAGETKRYTASAIKVPNTTTFYSPQTLTSIYNTGNTKEQYITTKYAPPAIGMLTIDADDWQTLKGVKVVKDGKHGKVLKSNSKSKFDATTDLERGSIRKPSDTVLRFYKANIGKMAKVCVNGRSENASGKLNVLYGPNQTHRDVKFDKSYGNSCYEVKINSNMQAFGLTQRSDSVMFVKKVTLTVK